MEAKVGASEGDQQLDRYNKEIARYEKNGFLILRVFLSPQGTKPEGGKEKWKRMSFSELARAFWGASHSIKSKPGYHFLQYYITGVLKDVLGLPVGQATKQENRYELLRFLKEVNAAKSRRIL